MQGKYFDIEALFSRPLADSVELPRFQIRSPSHQTVGRCHWDPCGKAGAHCRPDQQTEWQHQMACTQLNCQGVLLESELLNHN